MDTTTSQMRLGRLLTELRSLGAKGPQKVWLTVPTDRACIFNHGDVTVSPEWWKHNEGSVDEKLQHICLQVWHTGHYTEDEVKSFTMDNIDVQTSIEQQKVVDELMKYPNLAHLSLYNIGMGDECAGYLMRKFIGWDNLETLDISGNKITDTMKTKFQAKWDEHVKYMYHGPEFDSERGRYQLKV
jgi:hypothetical protein